MTQAKNSTASESLKKVLHTNPKVEASLTSGQAAKVAAKISSKPAGKSENKATSRVKLPAIPSVEAKHFMARLRKELRAETRRTEKLLFLEARASELRAKKEGETLKTQTDLSTKENELAAQRHAAGLPPVQTVQVSRTHRTEARRVPLDADMKLLHADVRRLLDEVGQAVSRVVTSRLSLATGDSEYIGKLDLITDERAFRPKPTRSHDRETLLLARLLYEVLDGSLHELEQALRAQYKKVMELRTGLSSGR